MVVTKSLPLDSDHFNFDLTEGFEMAVEKDWNVLDFTDLNDELVIYDSDLRALSPSKYGVRIFYKACIPMCYVDPENYPDNPLIKEADNASFRGKYLDLVDGTVIGSPVNKMSQGSTSEQSYGEFGYHGLLIADDVPTTKEAYALPNDRALNHTNVAKWAFATGSSLASCKVNGDYYQPKNINLYTENVKGFAYMLMNKGGMNDGGVASFIVNNGALAYSIDTSANRFNLPTDDDHVENYKYLQPALFVPFGVAFRDHLTLTDQETPVDTAGWFYCVLGVNEVGGEDPSYQIDPQLIRLSDGEGLQIDPVEGTYSYSDDISADSGTFGIEVADYCSIASILLNGSSLVVPSPVNNVYSVSFSGLTDGTNTLVIRTQDENEEGINYTFTLTYTAPPPPPAVVPDGYVSWGDPSTRFEDGVTSYTSPIYGTPIEGMLQIDLNESPTWRVTSAILAGVTLTVTKNAFSNLYETNWTKSLVNINRDVDLVLTMTDDTDTTTVTIHFICVTDEFSDINISCGQSVENILFEEGHTAYSSDLPTLQQGSNTVVLDVRNSDTYGMDVKNLVILVNDSPVTYTKTGIGQYQFTVVSTGDDEVDISFSMGPNDSLVDYTLTLTTPVTPQVIPYELTTGDSTPNSGTISLSSSEYNNYTLVHLTAAGASPNDYNISTPGTLYSRTKTAAQPYGFKLFPNSGNPPTLGDTLTVTLVDKSDSSITQDIELEVVS